MLDVFYTNVGERVVEPECSQDEIVVRSGSLLRNSGTRVSWRMVPSDLSSSLRVLQDRTSQSAVAVHGMADKEVVLKEVEQNQAVDEVEGEVVFQTTAVTLSSVEQVQSDDK